MTDTILVKNISQYLADHMEERITLKQLSDLFHVSGTYIKNSFKAEYGVSLYAYVRSKKMESAAYMLEHTDKSVLEIAIEHGYKNGSKFACAFRDIIGVTPNKYRSMRKK